MDVKNRMCIADDEEELSRLYVGLNLYAAGSVAYEAQTDTR